MQGLQQQHVQLSMVGHSPLKPLSMITFSFIISINVLKKNLVKFNCQSSKFSGYDIREPSPVSCHLSFISCFRLLHPFSCLPFPTCHLLSHVSLPRFLSHAFSPTSPVPCLLSQVSCLSYHILSHVFCLMAPVSLLLSPFYCLPSSVSLLLSPVSCLRSSVSCLLSHVSCLTSSVSCLTSHSRPLSNVSSDGSAADLIDTDLADLAN